jgi:hypothetical protein
MPQVSATQVMDELIAELGQAPGPCERVIDVFRGNLESDTINASTVYPVLDTQIHEKADAAVQELRRTWGLTADPSWVKNIVPGREQQTGETEFDTYFALFRREGFWSYVRIRAPETDTPDKAYLRLIFGVVRDRRDSTD